MKTKSSFIAATALSILLLATSSFAQLTKVSSGVTEDLNAIHFVDAKKGWVVGDDGLVLHTSDGGTTWVKQILPVVSDLRKVLFWDENTGYMINDAFVFRNEVHAYVYYTKNGGKNWKVKDFGNNFDFMGISFISPKVGWISGSHNGQEPVLLKTADGGETWRNDIGAFNATTHLSSLFNDVTFENEHVGLLFNISYLTDNFNTTTVFKTTDSGRHWTKVGETLSTTRNHKVISPDTLWTAGLFSAISFDSGITWRSIGESSFGFGAVVSVAPLSGKVGWYVRSGLSSSRVYYTEDAGKSSVLVLDDNTNRFNTSFLASDGSLWLAGDNGIVGVLSKSFGTPVISRTAVPEKFLLSQNFPNPFNPTTQINYSIENPGLVRISVFNVLGHKIATLVNEAKTAGFHSVKFDASHLASGTYFYRLTAGGFTDVKRMLLIK